MQLAPRTPRAASRARLRPSRPPVGPGTLASTVCFHRTAREDMTCTVPDPALTLTGSSSLGLSFLLGPAAPAQGVCLRQSIQAVLACAKALGQGGLVGRQGEGHLAPQNKGGAQGAEVSTRACDSCPPAGPEVQSPSS